MKTTAAVLIELNKPLQILELEIPPLQPGQVLVKVFFSGVCHSQLMEAQGKRGEDRFLPHLLGHEGSGEVIETGKEVTKVKPGDKVILGWIKGQGKDAPGCKYLWNGKTVNSGGVTTFSTYTVVSENRCVKLPDGIPMDVAVLFGCAIPTGSGITLKQLNPKANSTVSVIGLGGIGLSALMALRLFTCEKIIAVDMEDSKLELAKDFGATHFINSSRENTAEAILKLTNGCGTDYCVESAGLTRTIETGLKTVKKFGGLCIFASHPPAGETINLDPFDLISGRRIEGSWGGGCLPDEDIPKFLSLYQQGKLPLEKLISRQYRLEEINVAMEDLQERKVARAVLNIGSLKSGK